MHKSLNEFEIRPDGTTAFMATDRVTMGKTASSHFSQMFLIGFISYLQVTMIYTRA